MQYWVDFMTSAKSGDAGKPTFEVALGKLEGVVQQLEDGQLGLAESLAQYEQGVKLLRQCYDMLQHAERRIELLSGVDAQGNPIISVLADQSSLEADDQEQSARRSDEEAAGKRRPRRAKSPTLPPPDDVDTSRELF